MENSVENSLRQSLDKGTQSRSLTAIALMGMPHVGAYYANGLQSGHRRYAMDRHAVCAICGAPATNAHHVVPLGMGGKQAPVNKYTDLGIFPLYTPLFAVCGQGNASGCHKKLHSGMIIKWVWENEECEQLWESGKLWRYCKPNDQHLFNYGHYEALLDGEVVAEIKQG